jgi:hypothetical protein
VGQSSRLQHWKGLTSGSIPSLTSCVRGMKAIVLFLFIHIRLTLNAIMRHAIHKSGYGPNIDRASAMPINFLGLTMIGTNIGYCEVLRVLEDTTSRNTGKFGGCVTPILQTHRQQPPKRLTVGGTTTRRRSLWDLVVPNLLSHFSHMASVHCPASDLSANLSVLLFCEPFIDIHPCHCRLG